MRSRRSSQEQVAEVARRRLELLSAELAAIRPDPVAPPAPGDGDGSGEPLPFDGPAWPPPAALGPRHAPRPVASATAPPAPAATVPAATAAASSGPGSPTTPGSPTGPGRHAHRSVGVAASLAGWAQDRLPPTVQGRVRLSGAHLAVLCLVLVAGVALTAWWVSHADAGGAALPAAASAPAPVTTPPASAGSPLVTPTGGDPAGLVTAGGGSAPGPAGAAGAGTTSTGATGTTGATGSARIVVDVTGKVHHPGIATLPQGSRVVDALEAAGGPRRGASLASLNLARLLTDGEQIVVGVPAPAGAAAPAASGPSPGAGSTAATGQLVNLNTADQAQLETLPGVGPVTARAILDYRAEKGSFTSVEELLEVSGIGDATLAKVSPYCTL